MLKFGAVLNTSGSGYWSNEARSVECVGLGLGYINEEADFGELRVYFNTKSWDVEQHGLIYTDKQFIEELRATLDDIGLVGSDVGYSEQGMQGDDYVSLDVGAEFLQSFKNIALEYFNEVYNDML